MQHIQCCSLDIIALVNKKFDEPKVQVMLSILDLYLI